MRFFFCYKKRESRLFSRPRRRRQTLDGVFFREVSKKYYFLKENKKHDKRMAVQYAFALFYLIFFSFDLKPL
ncbi:hypothetical protein CJ467_09545 [Bacillus velezensis]|nr:hypothetical protein CJ467_09545 [Bacillus velezensis]